MDNQTTLNETLNETASNQTGWITLNPKELPSLTDTLNNLQESANEFLISWNFSPDTFYFQLLILAAVLLLGYHGFVWFTSKAGGGFKWLILGAFVIFIVIVVLGVKI